jgi:hypothetical protein
MTTRETPAIARIIKLTGMSENHVYDVLKTIKQFEGYAEMTRRGDETSSAYDAGFAGGLREALKMPGGINNWDISQAIRELTL